MDVGPLEPLPIKFAEGVSDKQLDEWGLTREQFDAFNATSFSGGNIPEAEPPSVLA